MLQFIIPSIFSLLFQIIFSPTHRTKHFCRGNMGFLVATKAEFLFGQAVVTCIIYFILRSSTQIFGCKFPWGQEFTLQVGYKGEFTPSKASQPSPSSNKGNFGEFLVRGKNGRKVYRAGFFTQMSNFLTICIQTLKLPFRTLYGSLLSISHALRGLPKPLATFFTFLHNLPGKFQSKTRLRNIP